MRFSLLLMLLVMVVSSRVAFGDFSAGGDDRPVVVHVPSTVRSDVPAPLLILLHGLGGNGAGQESYWRAKSAADERGLLLAAPDGTQNRWNATDACCGGGLDDSAYLRGLIDEIETVATVDPDRIFLGGLSNGGFMSHRMACDHADKVAGIASQAGATFLNPNRCTPSSPVHILQIHGTSDATVSFHGAGSFPGARATVAQWAQANGCAAEPESLDLMLDLDSGRPGAETSVVRHPGCREGGSAELWIIDGGSHVPSLTPNGTSTNLAAHVMDWLLAHPKRPTPQASFTLEPEVGAAPLEVLVDAAGSTAPAGMTIARYHWDFGDGTTAEDPVATHTYSDPGLYDVSLIVVSDDGRVSARARRSVVVTCTRGDAAPWTSSDVGELSFPGSARRETVADRDGIQICVAGRGISSSGDGLFFLYQEVEGDFRLTARVPEMADLGRAVAGVMARPDVAASAPFAATFLEPGSTRNRFRFRYREEAEGRARSDAGEEFDRGGWVRIERRGVVLSGSSSLDGDNWVAFEDQIDGSAETLLVGIAVASRQPLDPVQILVTDIELTTLDENPAFVRGDSNGDGEINISDASHLLGWLFAGDADLPCQAAGNANGDGRVDIADATYVLNFLFSGGLAPSAPFPECASGVSEVDEGLGCAEPPDCSGSVD